jgi:hypothetical protein
MNTILTLTVQIMCINKTDRYSPHERIHSIGGIHNGSRWKMTQQDAISAIERGSYSFFVSVGGRSVAVVVARSQYGNKYLKTVSDGEQPNNLLSLPECP